MAVPCKPKVLCAAAHITATGPTKEDDRGRRGAGASDGGGFAVARRVIARTKASVAVVPFEVILDGGGVGVFDRRAEGLDHFGHFGIPNGGARKRRVHLNVVEAVTGATIGLHLVQAGRLFELNWLFLGGNWKSDQCGREQEEDGAHVRLLTRPSARHCA